MVSKEEFMKFSDGKDTMTKKQFKDMLAVQQPDAKQCQVNELFKAFDDNSDGKISYEEVGIFLKKLEDYAKQCS